MEDRVLLSAALPDYHFTAPALVAGTTQHNAPISIGAFTKTPGGTTHRIVSNGSMQAVLPAAPSFTATAVSATQINLAWKGVAGATGYLVDVWINGVWKQIGSLGSGSTGCAVTGLSPNTTYYLDVAAYNAAGTTWANYQSATTFPVSSPAPKPCPWVIDHPVAVDTNGQSYHYAVVNGTLFGSNGPVYTDVHQTIIGDCWLLASFAEAAARAPQDITRMFTDLGTYMENGVQVHVWSVNFYDTTGVSRSVIVDNKLPVNSSGNTMSDEVDNGVLWVALAEKAYIQAAALGYVTIDNPADNSYMSINGGYPYYALAAITGHQATDVSIDAFGIDYAFSVGDLVVLYTGSTTSSSLIEPGHAYAVINDDPTATWQYTVDNPWNAGTYTTDDSGNTVYGSTFYCDADFINANWVDQNCAKA